MISCPSCARQEFNVIANVEELERRLEHISTPMTLSVIGCVVNGPGEARETDIGLTGGKSGHQIYLNGEKHHVLRDKSMIDHLVDLCEKKQKEFVAIVYIAIVKIKKTAIISAISPVILTETLTDLLLQLFLPLPSPKPKSPLRNLEGPRPTTKNSS